MELLKKEILEQAKLGFAVDIMEICKLYIASVSAVIDSSPQITQIENPKKGSTDGKLKAIFSARWKQEKATL